METLTGHARAPLRLAIVVAGLAAMGGIAIAQQAPQLVSPTYLLPEGLHRLLLWSELQAMRTFFERTDVLELSEGVQRPRASTRTDVGGWARTLGPGWRAPFNYVRDQVTYVPYAGSVRGDYGVLESGAGNALDQALLLRSLLAAGGIRSRLIHGRLAWSEASELVIGAGQSPAAAPGDPWPRWVETAADHWWLEAEIDGVWTGLDPAFPRAELGEVRGEMSELLDEVPVDLVARFRVEILHSNRLITGSEILTGTLIGSSVELFMESLSVGRQGEPAITPELPGAQPSSGAGRSPSGFLPQENPEVLGITSEDSSRGHGQLFVPEKVAPDPGPWMLHLVSADTHLEAGPLEAIDLQGLSIRLTVESPRAPVQTLEIPWGGFPEGRLTVVVGAGSVSAGQLGRAAEPLFDSLESLAAVELAAREAMRPPLAYADASIALHRATRASWADFTRASPAALGWAILSSVDRLSARTMAGRVLRPSLRLAAVRWLPPRGDLPGTFTVHLDDPIVVGQLPTNGDPAGLQSAYGLLQSAVVSQVMHRVAGHAPATAFDVTLRAIGTGQEMEWMTERRALPGGWPAEARALAAVDLQRGFMIVSPTAAELPAEGGELGWWSVGPSDGTTRGGIFTAHGLAQGEVLFGEAGIGTMLDEVLASLPDLHRGLRWLADLTGSGVDGLDTVPLAACASAAVAAETLAASSPDAWVRPDVALFCGVR